MQSNPPWLSSTVATLPHSLNTTPQPHAPLALPPPLHAGAAAPPAGPLPNGPGAPYTPLMQLQAQRVHHAQQAAPNGVPASVHGPQPGAQGMAQAQAQGRLLREDELLALFARILPASPHQALIISQELVRCAALQQRSAFDAGARQPRCTQPGAWRPRCTQPGACGVAHKSCRCTQPGRAAGDPPRICPIIV